jgi:integrin beta 3
MSLKSKCITFPEIKIVLFFPGAMIINTVGDDTHIQTSYGVDISWNNVYNVEIQVLGRYLDSMVGLCGTFNDDSSDDLLTSDNVTTTNVTAFGNSWKTDPACADAPTVENPCNADANRAAMAKNNCSALLQAPFWACNETVNATEEYFIADCEYDMCACNNPDACLCQMFDAYASACSAQNVNINNWIDDFPQCSMYK